MYGEDEKQGESVFSTIGEREFDSLLVTDLKTDVAYSYGTVMSEAIDVANWVRGQGYDTMLVCCDNSYELLRLYFSALFGNFKIVPIDPEKSESEIGAIREFYKGSLFLGPDDVCFTLEGDVYDVERAWAQVDFDKPFLVTFTSGSTGAPKGVIHSASNLFLSARAFADRLGYGRETKLAHVMPMTYMAGILNSIFLPFVAGGTIALFPRFNMKTAPSFWKNVEKSGANTFWLSPTILRMIGMMDRKGAYRDMLHDRCAKFSVGTAPLDITLRESFQAQYGIEVFQSYGLSETLFLTTETPEHHGDSSGIFLDGVERRIADDGELEVRVPWNYLGYDGLSEDNMTEDRFYKTGDLARISSKELHIIGRSKDLIVKGGYNINPKEIAAVVLSCSDASEVEVLGREQDGGESIVCAYVACEEIDSVDLNQRIAKELGAHYRVDDFIRLDELPKNLNGKVDKMKLRTII